MTELSEREKIISHISCIAALAGEHKTPTLKVAEIIESIRKNKCRKITQEECEELKQEVIKCMQEVADFLELYGNGDIPT